ncbi:Hypothetical protein ERGA_CDS_00590 [Ehrlichia ruminantium str. Gardel]|nr:Hypothetical protein ERGA_CDS_00590 [Ehrlichia ruminantium str. Gardel]
MITFIGFSSFFICILSRYIKVDILCVVSIGYNNEYTSIVCNFIVFMLVKSIVYNLLVESNM